MVVTEALINMNAPHNNINIANGKNNKNNNINMNNLIHSDSISMSIDSDNLTMMNTSDMDYSHIGRTVKTALMKAQAESRVIVGLSAAINVLSKSPEGSLFCLMAVPQDGDSATHMHEVLLEAFCYENDIYVIKVDCASKLSRILGKSTLESCCLVQKTWTGAEDEESLNRSESQLVDYCEAFWDAPQHPIVQLPPV